MLNAVPTSRRGPKPRPVTQRRRNRLMLNLTDDELRRLRIAAGGRPLTALARSLVLDALARGRGRAGEGAR
mgnify:CR=1 FL=1